MQEDRDADATLPTLDIGARSRPKGGCRALDIHIVLAERAGEVAGKAELIARVWPSANAIVVRDAAGGISGQVPLSFHPPSTTRSKQSRAAARKLRFKEGSRIGICAPPACNSSRYLEVSNYLHEDLCREIVLQRTRGSHARIRINSFRTFVLISSLRAGAISSRTAPLREARLSKSGHEQVIP